MSNLIRMGDVAFIVVPDDTLLHEGYATDEWKEAVAFAAGISPGVWKMADAFNITIYVTTKGRMKNVSYRYRKNQRI